MHIWKRWAGRLETMGTGMFPILALHERGRAGRSLMPCQDVVTSYTSNKREQAIRFCALFGGIGTMSSHLFFYTQWRQPCWQFDIRKKPGAENATSGGLHWARVTWRTYLKRTLGHEKLSMQWTTTNTNHKTFIQERTQLSNLGFSTDSFREKLFLGFAWKLKRWRNEKRKKGEGRRKKSGYKSSVKVRDPEVCLEVIGIELRGVAVQVRLTWWHRGQYWVARVSWWSGSSSAECPRSSQTEWTPLL